MKCKKGYEIKCLKSAAGYYIGTLDNEGFPNCRISGYFEKEVEPKIFRMTRMDAMENQFCHGYSSCLTSEYGINDMYPTNIIRGDKNDEVV